jgi:DNA-binding MarR family transcriptional regulator
MATTARSPATSRLNEQGEASPATSGLSEQELRAWRGMLRAHAALTKALDAQLEAEHGLPLVSYEVLLVLAGAPARKMRMSELAETVVLSRSGLTRLVDRLERDGLIRRQSCRDDARGAFAALTDVGGARLDAARATHLAGVRALFLDHLSPTEQGLLGDVWERVLPTAHAPGPRCA